MGDMVCMTVGNNDPLPPEAITAIGKELDGLHRMGAITYYLRSIPEGEQFVIGCKGQILKMDQDQVVCFLAGVTAVAECMARQRGLML